MSTPGPIFICLNLQQAYLDPAHTHFAPRGSEALIPARSAIDWARRQHLEVWHVHTRMPGRAASPILGFEPRACEPVLFKRGASFFDSVEVDRARPRLSEAFVIGFAAARDCLAAALDAERVGVKLAFITDAIASSSLPDQAPEVVDDVTAALLGQWAARVKTPELLRRELQLSMA